MADKKRLIDANEISYHKSGFPKGDGYDSGLDWAFREDIDKLPTVDAVEVVHGRWVMRGGKLYCSACQQRACVTRDMDDFWYTKGTNYCPNCGAKMDLEVTQ